MPWVDLALPKHCRGEELPGAWITRLYSQLKFHWVTIPDPSNQPHWIYAPVEKIDVFSSSDSSVRRGGGRASLHSRSQHPRRALPNRRLELRKGFRPNFATPPPLLTPQPTREGERKRPRNHRPADNACVSDQSAHVFRRP